MILTVQAKVSSLTKIRFDDLGLHGNANFVMDHPGRHNYEGIFITDVDDVYTCRQKAEFEI
jgi:hypothetical protein